MVIQNNDQFEGRVTRARKYQYVYKGQFLIKGSCLQIIVILSGKALSGVSNQLSFIVDCTLTVN